MSKYRASVEQNMALILVHLIKFSSSFQRLSKPRKYCGTGLLSCAVGNVL
uniref:Uncharacterized protein n=1 Tax=Anguilla anguilla TaxID=7936 RepID=A0A0E9XFK3_ANGAN